MIFLCLGDIELLRGIATHKIADDANLNDSQSRSARYLYGQMLISATPLEGSDTPIDVLGITPLGKRRLLCKDAIEKEMG